MNKLTEAVVTIATAIVGVAILAVLVSQKSNTSGVLTAGGNAFATSLNAATSPVSGGSTSGVAGFSQGPVGTPNIGGYFMPANYQ